MNITHSECVFVTLVIQPAMRMRTRPVWFYKISLHYLMNGKNFEKKKLLKIKCVLIFSKTLKRSSF